MAETEYQRLRRLSAEGRAPETEEAAASKQRRPKLHPSVRRARSLERNRRNVEARRRALAVLALRHEDEFNTLLEGERAGLDTEKGPLPGDQGYVDRALEAKIRGEVPNDGFCSEPCHGVGVLHPYHGVGTPPLTREESS